MTTTPADGSEITTAAPQRIDIPGVDPGVYKAVLALQKYASSSSLGAGLMTLIDIRASQLNGCAWCLDMHTDQAREAGHPQRKIDLVAAWRDTGAMFDPRERAALALTEQVTLIADGGVHDTVWAAVTAQFTETEIVELMAAISVINVWNRLNVTARTALPIRSQD